MTKNPFVNAFIAIAYIALVAFFMTYIEHKLDPVQGVIVPILMLSLLVLSASLMGVTFFYHPARMYIDGDKKGAVSLLAGTIGIFAGYMVLLIVAVLIIVSLI